MLAVEHRSAPAPDPITLVLNADTDVHLEVVPAGIDDAADADTADTDTITAANLDHAILQTLAQLPKPVTRAELRARLRVRNERLGEALARLVDAGSLRRAGDRFRIPDSHHP